MSNLITIQKKTKIIITVNNKSFTIHQTEGRKQSHLDLTKSSGWRVLNTGPTFLPKILHFLLSLYSCNPRSYYWEYSNTEVAHSEHGKHCCLWSHKLPKVSATLSHPSSDTHIYRARDAQTLLHTCQHTHACVVLTRARSYSKPVGPKLSSLCFALLIFSFSFSFFLTVFVRAELWLHVGPT